MLKHKDFDRVVRWVTSRDMNGYPIPCYTYGPPGGGKTHLAKMIADAIGAAFIPQSFGPTTTDTRVMGFLSAAHGTYVPGPAYKWYKEGGFYYLDEFDNCEPSAAVCLNALLANDTCLFPNGERVTKHKDTYAMAGANTLGTGATGGFRRQAQDAAVRSRWSKVRLEYDDDLERALSENERWVTYVQKVRIAVNRLAKSNVQITPRDSIIGAAFLRNGDLQPWVIADIMEHLLCELSPDARQQVIKEVGTFNPNPPPTAQPKASVPQSAPAPDVDLSKVPIPTWWTQGKKDKATIESVDLTNTFATAEPSSNPYTGPVAKKPTKKYREYE